MGSSCSLGGGLRRPGRSWTAPTERITKLSTNNNRPPLTVADAGIDPAPEPLTLAESIPPASIVGDFVTQLPGLAFQIPGAVSEVMTRLPDALPHFDREAG